MAYENNCLHLTLSYNYSDEFVDYMGTVTLRNHAHFQLRLCVKKTPLCLCCVGMAR